MGVYEDLLVWSRGRPIWQQDALRRLAQGAVTDSDVRELADLALSAAAGNSIENANPIGFGSDPTAPVARGYSPRDPFVTARSRTIR